MERVHILNAPTPAVLEYCSNDVIDNRPCAYVVFHIVALEFVAMALVQFHFGNERNIVGVQCYDQRDQKFWGVLTPLAAGVYCRIKHYGFASFVIGFTFDSALAYLVYFRSGKIDW